MNLTPEQSERGVDLVAQKMEEITARLHKLFLLSLKKDQRGTSNIDMALSFYMMGAASVMSIYVADALEIEGQEGEKN